MILHNSSEGMSKSSIKGSRDQFSQKATENLRKHPSIDQPNHQSIRLGTGSKGDESEPLKSNNSEDVVAPCTLDMDDGRITWCFFWGYRYVFMPANQQSGG